MRAADTFDAIIVGQGLAGTTLAWRLVLDGYRVGLIDPQAASTSSRIAAGLLTPITGKNLTLSPTYAAEFAEAAPFYRDIEARTGTAFFHERRAIRLFASAAEQAKWDSRAHEAGIHDHIDTRTWDDIAAGVVAHTGSGFAMRAAQLDTGAYLAAAARCLDVTTAQLDWLRDVTFAPDAIVVRGKRCRWLISCEGYAAHANPYWSAHLRFRAAKGEILTLALDRAVPPVVWHRGIWVAPTNDQHTVKTGASFGWDALDDIPTDAARLSIEAKLANFFLPRATVLRHEAAVRPIIADGRPVILRHPIYPRLLALNGLASKGALRGPLAARSLSRLMTTWDREAACA